MMNEDKEHIKRLLMRELKPYSDTHDYSERNRIIHKLIFYLDHIGEKEKELEIEGFSA